MKVEKKEEKEEPPKVATLTPSTLEVPKATSASVSPRQPQRRKSLGTVFKEMILFYTPQR
jgi:hypothetical protein